MDVRVRNEKQKQVEKFTYLEAVLIKDELCQKDV